MLFNNCEANNKKKTKR